MKIPEQTLLRQALLAVFVVALAIRAVNWPALHELRDGDELAYACGSLQLLEGNLPGIHYAPAGPQAWGGWLYASAISLKHFIFPEGAEKGAPFQLRPYLAINQTLFDAYRDAGWLRQIWVVMSCLVALAGVVAAFRLGEAKAGLAGALFMGGTIALLPLFVEFSVQARPYIVAWSFGLMALSCAAASSNPKSWLFSAMLMGLAVGSRIDMLLLLPVIWAELRLRTPTPIWWRPMARYHMVMGLTFIVVAPWFLMTLIACLRAVGTIRGATGLTLAGPKTILLQVVWEQGLLIHVVLFAVAIFGWMLWRPRRYFLALYIVLIEFSLFKGAAFGLRYQGAPLLLIVFSGLYCVSSFRKFSPTVALTVSLAALALPLIQTIKLISDSRANYVSDSATQWIETHVPPGTIIYLRPWITNPLPTRKAADEGWSEVTDVAAYQAKFLSGMERFGFKSTEIPRALSEVNLALERSNRRFLFILGSRQWLNAPRFETKVFESGPVFGLRDLPATFQRTGGVVVLRGPADDPLVRSLGEATVQWLTRTGSGTRIYCSRDILAHLN